MTINNHDELNTNLDTELDEFQEFLGRNGQRYGSLEEALQQFRGYQRELADLREKLRVSEAQSARGESRLFDADETKRSVRERLAEHGITD